MAMLTRRTIMLRPMQTGVSGYARLQAENGRSLVQVHARGIAQGGVRLFGCLKGQSALEMAAGDANVNGEVSLEAEFAQEQRLEGLVLITAGDEPRPLATGLCVPQSAGGLLEVKNAALALCDRLRKKPLPRPKPTPAVQPVVKQQPLPREIFLPAIDPAPYLQAAAQREPLPAERKPSGVPVDDLPVLRWPRGFESLQKYFDHALPVALLPMPGWRFVQAAADWWVGVRMQDGAVRGVAYAFLGERAPDGAPYRPARGLDGRVYQVLRQEV